MSRLGKPSFPVLISAEDIIVQVTGLIEENRWKDPVVKSPSLVFLPYWFFHFDSFIEPTDPETGEKSTEEGERGTAALDAISGDLDDNVPQLYDHYSDQLVVKPTQEQFKVERSHFREDEVQKLAQLKMAAKLGLQKDDVVISGVRMMYLPVWIASAVFEENEMDFEIDAVEGNVLSEDQVPYKGKTASEIAKETFFDLREPAKWIGYLIDLAKTIAIFLWTNPVTEYIKKNFWTNRSFQYAVLTLVVLLIILNDFVYHWWK
ncbi:MAG: hypothetical protein J4215_06250 [Candidatus Diapherotrites archaeon]|uniref:Uncharacterized protein n=1 Tax=Candidatus Iainarchaeum sp. TaxID=3101447 RepID=A0A8T4L6A0_9ARCH|nr:hypothetical protein [Candidatus Diapherotrites archaeon]